jgi:hypothetical protein
MYNKDHGIVAMNNHAIFNIMMCWIFTKKNECCQFINNTCQPS